MVRKVKEFCHGESGAVTVDWVVLCAGLAGMAALVASQMHTGAVAAADQTSTFMQEQR
ncbi:MAG: hypothetical protein NXH82_05440 [Rhodobacteraceae bacterium]|nr:hypothetical protein [Paracoccaceae bacterium]